MEKPHQPAKSDYLSLETQLGLHAKKGLPSQPISPDMESEAAEPEKPGKRLRKPRKWGKKRIILTICGLILAVLLGVGGWIGYKFIHATLKTTNGNIFGLLTEAKLNGEDTGRVNILLAGNSADDPGHGGAELTDSLMIASIDTKDNTAFLMSIPRDLWVNVPGYGHQRINAVYPEGGMPLLERVVESDFGVTINYYTLVDYTAFKQAVDAVGGITVNIQSSDPRGIYDPNIGVDTNGAALRLANGVQNLNGQTALNLARARNDPTPSGKTGYGLPRGDFDRAANQRLMLTALAQKATSASTLTNPVKISQLLDALGNNVKTDFTTNDLRRLASLAKKLPAGNVQSLSLQDSQNNINLIKDYTTAQGAAVLIPAAGVDDFNDIQQYLAQLTSSDPIVKEGANIVVLNASGTAGLAKSEATTLEAKKLNVSSYANAPTPSQANQIIAVTTTAKPATLALLKSTLGVQATTTSTTLAAQYPNADYIVILGTAAISSPSPMQ